MHEYSIVQALLEQCKTYAQTNHACSITEVTVKIGMQSGVEIHLFETAFETFKEHTVCHSATLTVLHQPLRIYCGNCQKEYTLSKPQYLCPQCQNLYIRVLDGEEMVLMRLEMI